MKVAMIILTMLVIILTFSFPSNSADREACRNAYDKMVRIKQDISSNKL